MTTMRIARLAGKGSRASSRRTGARPSALLALLLLAAAPGCGHSHAPTTVSATGRIGKLRIGSSTAADVRQEAGAPSFAGEAQGYGPYHALGYSCSGRGGRGQGFDVGGDASARTWCRTIYFVDRRTHRLAGFWTDSAGFRTEKGARPGMREVTADRLEGAHPHAGVLTGIRRRTRRATLFVENSGCQQTDLSGRCRGGRVRDLILEGGHRVGLLAAGYPGFPLEVSPPASKAQALRDCVDRWNQSAMVTWDPGPANVAYRRPVAKERSTMELPLRRQCIVAIAAGDGTWTCILAGSGAYWCPPRHETSGPALKALHGKNATIDVRDVLKLAEPLKGTRPAQRLAWQRYPHVEGFIAPWTSSGTLRPGLRFYGEGRGRCFLVDETAVSGISCITGMGWRYDACYPERPDWRPGDLAACASEPGDTRFVRWTIIGGAPSHPPVLSEWRGMGTIFLGEPRAGVLQAYGPQPAEGYRLRAGRVEVTYFRGRVDSIWFSTRHYRAYYPAGPVGVGSRIPLGPCHRTKTNPCEHRWHGFVWNSWNNDQPCNCWTKVGLGPKSLPATGKNFLKPWFFIYTHRGRVSYFYFSSRFID
jgi:hypothetical protein